MLPSDMPADVARSKSIADRFEIHAKRVLGEHLFRVATAREDMLEATDFKVLVAGSITVGWRHRAAEYLRRYPHDITIRFERPKYPTEYEKIMSGWGDYFLYSLGDDPARGFDAYRLIDLSRFRIGVCPNNPNPPRFSIQKNPDGSSDFIAFDTRTFAPGVEIAKWRRRG